MTTDTAVSVKEKESKRGLRTRDWFEDFGNEMARMWHEWPPLAHWRTKGLLEAHRMPAIDMFERGDKLIVKADLPGMKQEEIELRLEDGDLVIAGDRNATEEVKEDDYYRMERSYGSFSRRIQLPFEAKSEDIRARFEDSVLRVEIHKPAGTKPIVEKIKIR